MNHTCNLELEIIGPSPNGHRTLATALTRTLDLPGPAIQVGVLIDLDTHNIVIKEIAWNTTTQQFDIICEPERAPHEDQYNALIKHHTDHHWTII